jgi:hypothetical protein
LLAILRTLHDDMGFVTLLASMWYRGLMAHMLRCQFVWEGFSQFNMRLSHLDLVMASNPSCADPLRYLVLDYLADTTTHWRSLWHGVMNQLTDNTEMTFCVDCRSQGRLLLNRKSTTLPRQGIATSAISVQTTH